MLTNRALINRALRRLGYNLVRISKSGRGYSDATETVEAARANGVSIREDAESVRVCSPQGHMCFDFFRAKAFDEPLIMRWLEYPKVIL